MSIDIIKADRLSSNDSDLDLIDLKDYNHNICWRSCKRTIEVNGKMIGTADENATRKAEIEITSSRKQLSTQNAFQGVTIKPLLIDS